MNQHQTVLILSSNRAFSRELIENWQGVEHAPEFVLLEEGLGHDLARDLYDLAIVEVAAPEKYSELKRMLAAAEKPVIVLHAYSGAEIRNFHYPVLELSRADHAWATTAVLLGREILGRLQAESRAAEAERLHAAAHAEATLGRYMVEMFSSVNNALTSVLGNAELLKLEPGVPAPVLAQADTIHNMALRLHEVFQRFSSLEKELCVAARESGKRTGMARAASTGI
jgi:signal transduction histidine kinase